MEKKILNILLVLFLSFYGTGKAFAQEIDSLKLDTLINVLTLQLDNERTVNAYTELTNDYIFIADYETALRYANLGIELSEKIGYKEGELESTSSAAHIHLAYYLDYSESIKLYDRAYTIADELQNDEEKIRIYRGYTSIYSALENYDKALEYNSEAISIAREIGDEQVVSDLNAYGGNIHEELGDTAKAMEMYEEVVDIETSNNFKNTSKASLVTIAHYYYMKGDIDKSLKQYRIALKRFERLKDLRWVAYTHSEMAKIYFEVDNYERVEMHGLKGFSIAEDLSLVKEKMDNSSILAELYRNQDKDSLADFYQNIYDSLLAQTITEVSSDVTISENSDETNENETNPEPSPFAGVLNTLIIMGLVGVAVFITGLKKPSQK